jgi:hypothetical protein
MLRPFFLTSVSTLAALAALVTFSVTLGVACSSSIPEVAPGDDDAGNTDTGGTNADVGLDALDTSIRLDTSPGLDAISDVPASDGGGPDGIVGGDATTDGPVEKTCTVSATTGEASGCALDEYCDAPTCASGVCRRRPISLPDFNPICGCDGVTYWNDHFAGSRGRSTRLGSGACGGGSSLTKVCGGFASRSCPNPDMQCVSSGTDPSTCTTTDLGGLCWSIPTTASCLSATGSKKERVCGSGVCTTRCDAIKSSSVFYDDSTCP